jgi:CIC family chloride channel protein
VLRDDHVSLIAMAAAVGVLSGAAAGTLLAWIEFAGRLIDDVTPSARWLDLVLVLVLVTGGALAGLLQLFTRKVVGEPLIAGVAGVITAITRRDGRIDGRQALVVGIGTGVTIGSGGSCGYEAPAVAIGAAAGSVFGRAFRVQRHQQLAMLGAGCAAGLASAFDAPLAGVIFTIEIVFRSSIGGSIGTMSTLLPLVVAAVSGTFVSHAIRGEHPAFSHTSFAWPTPPELLCYAVMGIVAGFVGLAFIRALVRTGQWFRARRWPHALKPAIGALAVGLVAAASSTAVLGAGNSTVASALRGDLAWSLALELCLLKIVTTSFTLGSGGFGGTLMPSLYLGATMGTALGALAELMLGAVPQGPGAFAVVGMGAVFAAAMHAPLTPIVVILELTRDYATMMPLMLACILAVYVARRFGGRSLTESKLVEHGVETDLGVPEASTDVLVRGHMLSPEPTVDARASVETVCRAACGSESGIVLVVDDGLLIGCVDARGIVLRSLRGELRPADQAHMLATEVPKLYASDTVAGALQACARAGLDALPVVDEEHRPVGILRCDELLSQAVMRSTEPSARVEANADPHVELGRDVKLERMIVGRRWAGHSLAEVDLRERTGCVVMEWVRGEATLPIDPRAPLREGDMLAIIGSRAQLRAARRLSVGRA